MKPFRKPLSVATKVWPRVLPRVLQFLLFKLRFLASLLFQNCKRQYLQTKAQHNCARRAIDGTGIFCVNFTMLYIAACAFIVYLFALSNLPTSSSDKGGLHKKTTIKNVSVSKLGKLRPFFVSDKGGKPLSLARYKGKRVIINFWATWCAPCVKELLELDSLQHEIGDKWSILPISVDKAEISSLKEFYERNGIKSIPILSDRNDSFFSIFKSPGMPYSVIVDSSGNVVYEVVGYLNWNSKEARRVLKGVR